MQHHLLWFSLTGGDGVGAFAPTFKSSGCVAEVGGSHPLDLVVYPCSFDARDGSETCEPVGGPSVPGVVLSGVLG